MRESKVVWDGLGFSIDCSQHSAWSCPSRDTSLFFFTASIDVLRNAVDCRRGSRVAVA